MTTSRTIDLSSLPAPAVVEALDYETIRAAMIADFRARDPAFDAVLESDPAIKVLEAAAYREMLLRQRVNDAARAVMLASAGGSDLDHLAVLVGTERLEITPADPTASPPTAAVMESDEDLRRRAQLAWESLSTAGPEGAYIYHALSADPAVRDVTVASPAPGDVLVTILARNGDGTPSAETLAAVEAHLRDDDVRPLTDTVMIQPARIVPYQVRAVLTLYHGPAAAPVLDAALSALVRETARLHALGHDVTRSALYAALHQPGVMRVDLMEPAEDIVIAADEAAYCAAADVAMGGRGV